MEMPFGSELSASAGCGTPGGSGTRTVTPTTLFPIPAKLIFPDTADGQTKCLVGPVNVAAEIEEVEKPSVRGIVLCTAPAIAVYTPVD